MDPRGYARKSLRIRPRGLLCADVCIEQIGDRAVHTNITRIRVLDISSGGLRFASPLMFPVNRSVILKVLLELDFKQYVLHGFIVHSEKTEVGEYEYGLCFAEPDEKLKEALKKMFGRMLRKVGENIIVLRI